MSQNHDQMSHSPSGVTTVVKASTDQNLTSSIKPEFSFDYDSLLFSTSLKEYTLGTTTSGMSDGQIAEVLAYLETVTEDVDLSAKLIRLRKAESYLAATDWMVLRKTETGVDIPADVTDERAVSRQSINDLKDPIQIQIKQ